MYKSFHIDGTYGNKEFGIVYVDFSHVQEKHIHDGIEIVYIVEGNGVHYIDGERIETKKGTLLIINPDSVHSFVNIEQMKYFNLMFKTSFLHKELADKNTIEELFDYYNVKTDKNFIVLNFFDEDDEKKTEKVFNAIFSECINKKIRYMDVVHGKFEELVIKIIRKYITENKDDIKDKTVFDEALEYITENCCNKLSLDEVSEMFGYESTHFSRMLKKNFGYGFKQLIIKGRLNAAVAELWGSEETIENVLIKYGFTNKTHFYKSFEKYYGVKPKNMVEYGKNYSNYMTVIAQKSENDT